MVKLDRPSAVDLWPDRPSYSLGPAEEDDLEPRLDDPPAQPQRPDRRRGDDVDTTDSDSDSEERPTRNKNLNPTCVTPLIAELAKHIYRELRLTGSPVRSVDTVNKNDLIQHPDYIEFMDRLLELVHALPGDVVLETRYRKSRRTQFNPYSYYSAVKVNTLLYEVDDIIIVPAGEDGRHPPPQFPESAPRTLPFAFAGDLFWQVFGRILSIKQETYTAHVQWLQHGSKTIVQELAHPQELFLTDLCSDIQLGSFLARCQCRKVQPGERPGSRYTDAIMHTEFFFSLFYDQTDAVFRDISEIEDNPNRFSQRLGACGLCTAKDEDSRQDSEDSMRLPLDDGRPVGFERAGIAYHCQDAVLVDAKTTGPCLIGQITSISEDFRGFVLTIQVFERMNDVTRKGNNLVADQYEDRHLFRTDRNLEVHSDRLLGKAFVLHKRSAKRFRMRGWLDYAPNHFYITKFAPTMDCARQGELTPLASQDFLVCAKCAEEEVTKTFEFLTWKENTKHSPLRIFDPFAGCGAMALGICEAGNVKFTHGIEISSSAAETIRKNSPDTIVYNQCSNKMLEYATLRLNDPDFTLTDLESDEDLPAPPRREDIDCIVCGFPCQTHSSLNMFQRARDLQNELFLNMLSWVDFMRPKYCLFENVPGFVQHCIGATQKDFHTVQGGIVQGGIKFVCRALTALGYQVRFALLQAAHYGVPQTRERFFLWAARTGLPLPEFPPRTHDFNVPKALSISFSNGDVVKPIPTTSGITPLPQVTIADAISDLKRWDWVNPHKVYKQTTQDRRELERREHILQVQSHYGDEACGIGGVEYEHEPRAAFQARCRRRPAEELQHVTPCFKDEIIERTVNIPVEAGANYKHLNNKPGLWEWQMMNPSSANAQQGYKTSMYARLEADKYFPTIVTLVSPTAKQSKVLNPWCKRMVTVRELARSQGIPDDFEFVALDRKVKTMHKLIGNAVPWQMSEALGRELVKAWYKETKAKPDEMER